jgi:hypothetical protein
MKGLHGYLAAPQWRGPLSSNLRTGIKGRIDVLGHVARLNAEVTPLQQATASEMDGSAMIAYFQPLVKRLEEQNKGRQRGW